MRRYVLTGAPGAGKTSVLRALLDLGFAVVEEAATDVIASEQARGVDEPWRDADFIDKIVALQRQREQAAAPADGHGAAGPQPAATGPAVQVHDRSALCTLALARFLDRPVTPLLAAEVMRVIRQQTFQTAVFLVRPIGFVERTPARRISYPESVAFERLHEAVYREHGFGIVSVPAAGVAQRAALIADFIASRPSAG